MDMNNADNWRDDAACRDLDTNLFFPDQQPHYNRHVQNAKRICNTCTVKETCLATALRYETINGARRYGIYGGHTPQERANMPPPPHTPTPTPIRHGTRNGAQRHRNNGEKPCVACRNAEAEHQQQLRYQIGEAERKALRAEQQRIRRRQQSQQHTGDE